MTVQTQASLLHEPRPGSSGWQSLATAFVAFVLVFPYASSCLFAECGLHCSF